MNKEPLLELIKFTVGLDISDNDLPEMTFSIRIDDGVIKPLYELLGTEPPIEELRTVMKNYAVAVSEILNLGDSSYFEAARDNKDTADLVERLQGKGKLVS